MSPTSSLTPWVVLAASDGTGHDLADPDSEAWPAILARTLPPPAPPVINRSIGGLTLDRAVAEVLPGAVALRPAVALVWLVVNDLAYGRPLDDYAADLDALLAPLTGTGAAVYLGNVPDLSTVPMLAAGADDLAELRTLCRAWNDVIADRAARYRARVVDFSAEPVPPENLGIDGFHPSRRGHVALAERFRAAVLGGAPPVAAAGRAG